MTERASTEAYRRLQPRREQDIGAFLDHFEGCLSRLVQRGNVSPHFEVVLRDSERKSIEVMHGRLTGPGSQGMQCFIAQAR